MKSQFTSFTPRNMEAIGNEITAMLGKFRAERRERAMAGDEARKLFRSELRSGVRALLDRYQLTQKKLASDILAARKAFRKSRPRKAPRQRRKAAA
ncbi:MAG: hypothetical protein WCK73_06000 [Deltaproteobacteria bacterium]